MEITTNLIIKYFQRRQNIFLPWLLQIRVIFDYLNSNWSVFIWIERCLPLAEEYQSYFLVKLKTQFLNYIAEEIQKASCVSLAGSITWNPKGLSYCLIAAIAYNEKYQKIKVRIDIMTHNTLEICICILFRLIAVNLSLDLNK